MPLLNIYAFIIAAPRLVARPHQNPVRLTPVLLVAWSSGIAAAASPHRVACSIRPLARPALQGHRVWHQTNANYARTHNQNHLTCYDHSPAIFGHTAAFYNESHTTWYMRSIAMCHVTPQESEERERYKSTGCRPLIWIEMLCWYGHNETAVIDLMTGLLAN